MNTEPVNWDTIPAKVWAAQSNAQLAARYQCSRQNVAHHRARLRMPDSPETPGGDRITPAGHGSEKTTAVINCTKAQKRRWMQAKEQSRQPWDQWAAAALDAAAETD